MKRTWLFTPWYLAATAPVFAADVIVEAPIDEVKVYVEGASITRKAQANIPAGSHQLVFRGLPTELDPDTLRINVGHRAVRLGGIEVERITDKDYVSGQERELRDRLQTLTDQKTAVQDDIATAETQLKLLESLAAAPSGTGTRPGVDANNLAAVLNTMSTSAAAARTRVREGRQKERLIDRDIAKVNADLQKIATARKQTYEVRASIEAEAAVNPAVSIEYTTSNAEWRWVYEARLDTAGRRISIGRQAAVTQRTGEDWSRAALTLTTAQPAEDAMTPQLASLFLDLEEEDLRRFEQPAMSPVADVSEVIVTGAMRQSADRLATDYLVEYRIPGRVTLQSDGEPRLYPVAEEALAVDLTARVIPAASRAAYLEATFTYAGDVPIQGGEVQLFRDGAFVGKAQMAALLPGAKARIPFGADERIQVAVRDEAKQSGEKGLVSRQRVDEHKQRFEVTSYHAVPIQLEILDRVPVAENKDIKVEVLKGATEPAEKDHDGKAGVMLWRVTAQPKQTATVRHYYAVRYPADRELSEREEED